MLAPHAVHLMGARLELVLHGQRHLQRQRADGLHQQLTDGTVERATNNALADWSRMLDALALAGVLRHDLTMADVVADRHPSAAPTTHCQALEQRRAFSRRAMPPVGAVRLTVVMQATEVVLVVGPGDVTGVRVTDQRMPLLTRKWGTHLRSVRPSACLVAAVGERAGVARVLERA